MCPQRRQLTKRNGFETVLYSKSKPVEHVSESVAPHRAQGVSTSASAGAFAPYGFVSVDEDRVLDWDTMALEIAQLVSVHGAVTVPGHRRPEVMHRVVVV